MKHATLSRIKRVRRCAEEEDGLPVFVDTAWMSRDDSVLALPYDGRHLPVLTDVVEGLSAPRECANDARSLA